MTEPDLGPTADDKRAALDAVLGSRAFERSTQLQSFLRYVCETEIAGRAAELSEQVIGVEALGRPAGYSPAEDPVVRRRAIDLREKLQEVYAGELADAPFRIELPKGRYVPRFVAAAAEAPTSPGVVPEPGRARSAARSVVRTVGVFIAGVAVGVLGARLRLTVAPAAPAALSRGTSYEAEHQPSVPNGLVARDRCEACSGGARLRNLGRTPGNHVVFPHVRVPATGPHLLTIHYLLNGERVLRVSVNGEAALSLPLKGDTWSVPAQVSVVVTLRAGANTIKLYNDEAVAPDLDRIVVW